MLSILVTGANGVVGKPLMERLEREGVACNAVSRSNRNTWLQWDLTTAASEELKHQIEGHDCLIHCAPIWLLPPHLETINAAGIRRLIVFSSTSVISKKRSADPQEQKLVTKLSDAEEQILAYCRSEKLRVTVLRPSMIYGYGRDQNVSHIAALIKKYGFMVLVGKAAGLRQPVHADDLVDACFKILQTNSELKGTYNLAGGEVISYRIMVERIFQGLGIRRRIISLPLRFFRVLLWSASKITRFNYTPEMANRMNLDLNYSNQDAIDDFAYSPQPFLQEPNRDLV